MYNSVGMYDITAQPLAGKELTGEKLYAAIDNHYSDLGSYAGRPFGEWFRFVKSIPYVSDMERFPQRLLEVVPRPAYILDRNLFPRIDCKKKSILIGSWAKANGVPFRLIAVSDRADKEATHVFPQLDFGNGWVNTDATLPEYFIGRGQGPSVTFAAELKR